MARLSQQALQQYRQQGFVRGGKILSDSELARLREEIDRLIAGLPAGTRPENMPSVHYRDRYFLDLFLSEPLVDIAEQILGPDVALFTSYVISKRPADGLEVEWHQDAAFFSLMQSLRRVLELHGRERHGSMGQFEHVRSFLHATLRKCKRVLQRQSPAQLGSGRRMRLSGQRLQDLRPFMSLVRF